MEALLFFSSHLLGILMALTSASVWGGGDFTGGLASRRSHPFTVLALSAFSGIGVLWLGAVLWQEGWPSLFSIFWAMLGGVSGAVGITSLYRALSMGQAAMVAPTTAVISALLPVIFTIFSEGLPNLTRLIGFLLALLGIGLVSQSADNGNRLPLPVLGLAGLAGLGFGGFFIFMGQVENGFVFTPLVVARCFTLVTAMLLLWRARLPLPSLKANPTALLAGLLDAGGNVFYLLAKQFTRLDIAAVLSSLYPATTVLLAYLILKEKITPTQWLGVVICLGAVVFITL